jgi:hypothetical protein
VVSSAGVLFSYRRRASIIALKPFLVTLITFPASYVANANDDDRCRLP